MLSRTITRRNGVQNLINEERIQRVEIDGKALYAAVDVVGYLGESEYPAELWTDLKRAEPMIAAAVVETAAFEAIDLATIFRLAQVLRTSRAAKLQHWLVQTAVERIEEADDPELALLRTRHAYEAQGRRRQWVDQRMRSVSGRQELAGEWYRRGVREGEEFRALTNEIMAGAFGMDVETYRRYKGLFRTRENLRDHMSELELALTTLAESTAVELARQRRSHGFDALLLDAKETGQIIGRTRREIEERTGRPVLSSTNYLPLPRPIAA